MDDGRSLLIPPGRAFLAGGGAMGARIRAHDWAATPLGPPEGWPATLKSAVRTALTTRHPVFLFWGAEHACLYNDAYSASLGPEKHPAILGAPGRDAWPEIWHIIGPQIAQVMAGGEATWHEDQLVPITRHGRLDEVYWTYSYGPVHDEAAPRGVGGVLVLCTETTARVLAERERAREATRLLALFEQAPGFLCVFRGPDHVYELVNAAHRRLLGGRDLTGLPVREALPELAGQGYFELLDDVYTTGEPYVGRARPAALRNAPGAPLEERFVDVMFQPIRDAAGSVTGILCEGMDVTDAVRAAATLRESEERYRLIVEGARDYAIFTTDAEDRVETWPPGAAAVFGWSAGEIIGRPMAVLFTPEDRATGVPAREVATARAEGRAPDVRWHLRKDGARVFIEGSKTALRAEDGRLQGFLKIGQDVTARKAAEERQALLSREVDHRAKNALAVIQAALRLTKADDLPAYVRAIEGRVAALARAQTLLAEDGWAGADLGTLLRGELAPFLVGDGAEGGPTVALDGPPATLPPGAAQPLAMAVHELATNALKHGALSTPTGRVAVSWTPGGGPVPTLRLRWAESGGPPVPAPPARRGFGTRVLDGAIRGQLGGTVSLAWDPSGLVCDVAMPLARDGAAVAAGTAGVRTDGRGRAAASD